MEWHLYIICSAIITFGLSTALAQGLPLVDLGYSVHQATFNFATAPVFSRPRPITTFNRTINTGQIPGICAQSTPWWEIASAQLSAPRNSSIQEVNDTYTSIQKMYKEGNATLMSLSSVESDARTAQECLTLDVIVPKGVWDETYESRRTSAPVIVWIFGGGYVSGDKNSAGDPSTLIAQSVNQDDPSSGVIFVAINYRLGLFGWLSGPKFQSEGGTSNLALYDQRAGLDWVQQNIHLFGGDPDRVTVMGESAGAGSIMHHLIASGGRQKAPFQQAIIQSPAFAPYPRENVQDTTFQMVLKWASILSNSQVTTFLQLQQLPFDILLKLNQLSTIPAVWGTMTWAPTVDGAYIPKPAGLLLKQGLFDRSVKVMTGHNSNEGTIFGSPLIADEDQYMAYLQQLLPDAANVTIAHVNEVLYPPIFNGSQLYKSEAARQVTTITDAAFICNSRYIDLAYNPLGAMGYYFDVSPGYHAQDLDYTFFNNEGTVAGTYEVNITLAQQMQRLLTNFAQTGNPGGNGVPTLPAYGGNSTLWSISQGAPVVDVAATRQCDWWQEAYYLSRDQF